MRTRFCSASSATLAVSGDIAPRVQALPFHAPAVHHQKKPSARRQFACCLFWHPDTSRAFMPTHYPLTSHVPRTTTYLQSNHPYPVPPARNRRSPIRHVLQPVPISLPFNSMLYRYYEYVHALGAPGPGRWVPALLGLP